MSGRKAVEIKRFGLTQVYVPKDESKAVAMCVSSLHHQLLKLTLLFLALSSSTDCLATPRGRGLAVRSLHGVFHPSHIKVAMLLGGWNLQLELGCCH